MANDGAKFRSPVRLPGRPRFKLIFLILILCALLFLFGTSTRHGRSIVASFPSSSAHDYLESLSDYLNSKANLSHSSREGCTPSEYASGRWVRRPFWARRGPSSRTGGDEALFDIPDSDSYNDSTTETEPQTKPRMKMKAKEDALKFSRFEGCASTREYWLQLGVDVEALWDRFPGAHEWEWVPGGRCRGEKRGAGGGGQGGLREWDAEEVVRDLVERGGWLLVGDSVTENHFFSLSCLLYPHVIAVPDYRHKTFDRGFPQNLFLNPDSPLLLSTHYSNNASLDSESSFHSKPRRTPLRFPVGFDPEVTPLITYRRVDLLFSQPTLTSLHRALHPEIYKNDVNPGFALFGEERTWTLDPEEYLGILRGGLPEANYRAMVVSTGGHWTTGLVRGYHVHGAGVGMGSRVVWGDESEGGYTSLDGQGGDEGRRESRRKGGMEVGKDGRIRWDNGGREVEEGSVVLGYDGLLTFFGEVMHKWAATVQSALDADPGVVQIASSPPGHRPSSSKFKSGIQSSTRAPRQVILRPYLPGHVDCHAHREPFGEVRPVEREYWNWQEVWKYNRIFEIILAPYKNLHYLKIERPGRLRPDAHSSHDCLHIMSGAGVLEGWTNYIWHYLTREV